MSGRLVLVDDGVPRRTIDLLLHAAARSALTTHVVRASQLAFADASQLAPGDLLYRPAVSSSATRAERFLFGPGVITFYRDADGIYFDLGDPYALFARAGVPTMLTVYCTSRRRQTLETLIQQVGGFPMVAKVPGGEGGVGVVRLDSRAALFSFVDFVLGGGHSIQLMPFIPDATHIRAVVVGDRVVASYTNIVDPDDFRTTPSSRVEDYQQSLLDELSDVAIAATRAVGVEFGGVDLLLDQNGRPHVLEVNFPCFHAQAEVVAGAPVSDAMVQHLLDKRQRVLGVPT